jgi:MoaA/NifB/PqqE/SkfB family radical SAM enzyme
MASDALADTASKSLIGLHLLLTYECNYECEHCFVWGGPSQKGTMTEEVVEHILAEAAATETVQWIYFEGGEPFLYYETLCNGVREARERGFKTGIVTNAYWATSEAEAIDKLTPLAGLVDDLSVSDDNYHGSREGLRYPELARSAAQKLDIPIGVISVAEPEATQVAGAAGKLPAGESAVLYRGRAAELLAPRAVGVAWDRFDTCPWEELHAPERVHVDPYGNLHVCQGISIGNLLHRSLRDILADYDPEAHPIVGPLLAGGPSELVRRYELPHRAEYADHCHLCYECRGALRFRFEEQLTPDQMYGNPI